MSKEIVVLKDECWVDKNNNAWNAKLFTKEEAIKHSQSLINCFDCKDCKDCFDCEMCFHCKNCNDCSGCINCNNCEDCWNCEDCSNSECTKKENE